MKKLLVIILSSLLLLLSMSSICLAAQSKTISENKEITDINQLWDRACKGISDDHVVKLKAVLKDAPEDLVIDKKQTTQKLKEIKRADGNIETFFATTSFAILKKSEPITIASLSNDSLWLQILAASKAWDEYDDSISIRHVGTFYYSSYRDSSTHLWVKPQSISCKWYRDDSSVSISSSRYGMEWWGYNGSGFVGNTDYNSPLPITWGSTYTNTCISVGGIGYIDVTPAGCFVSGQQRDTLVRGGSSWAFQSDYVFEENT